MTAEALMFLVCFCFFTAAVVFVNKYAEVFVRKSC